MEYEKSDPLSLPPSPVTLSVSRVAALSTKVLLFFPEQVRCVFIANSGIGTLSTVDRLVIRYFSWKLLNSLASVLYPEIFLFRFLHAYVFLERDRQTERGLERIVKIEQVNFV